MTALGYREIAEEIREKQEANGGLHEGPWPMERALLRIENLLEALLLVAIRGNPGVAEALRELEREERS